MVIHVQKSVVFQFLSCFPRMTECVLAFGNAIDGYLVICLRQPSKFCADRSPAVEPAMKYTEVLH